MRLSSSGDGTDHHGNANDELMKDPGESWTDDEIKLNHTTVDEARLWIRARDLYELPPQDLIPPGVVVDITDNPPTEVPGRTFIIIVIIIREKRDKVFHSLE